MPDADDVAHLRDDEGKAQISQFVDKFLKSQNLVILEGDKVTRALEKYIEKGDTGAIGA